MAGIVAGDGWNRPGNDPTHGRYVGTAPDADLIALNTADDQGDSSILAGPAEPEEAKEHLKGTVPMSWPSGSREGRDPWSEGKRQLKIA